MARLVDVEIVKRQSNRKIWALSFARYWVTNGQNFCRWAMKPRQRVGAARLGPTISMAQEMFSTVPPRSGRRRAVASWIRQKGQRTAKLQEEFVVEKVDLVLDLCKCWACNSKNEFVVMFLRM